MSEKCKFGDQLDDMLRDRLVCGVADPAIQKRLLQEKTLKFKRAFELAQGMEAAARGTADLQGNKINKLGYQGSVSKPRQGNGQKKSHHMGTSDECYRCGGAHSPSGCPFKSSKCYNCGLIGHIKAKCRKSQKGKGSKKIHHTAHTGTQQDQLGNQEKEYQLFTCTNRINPYVVELRINTTPVSMEIDTGASASVISEAVYKLMSKGEQKPQLQSTDTVLRTYTGEQIPVLGIFNAQVEYAGIKKELPLLVVKGTQPCLLGRDWLNEIRINWHEVKFVQKDLDNLLQKHSAVFEEGLGEITGVKASIEI